MPEPADTERNLNTILTAIEILETIEENGGGTLTDLATDLEMATSTIHDYLITLENAQYITKTDGEYRIGLKFFKHGMHAKRSIGVVPTAEPIIEKIAAKTGETVWLAVEEYGKSVLIDRALGENSVPMEADVGDRVSLHSVASGKAMLAHRDEEHVREVIDRYGLPARTEHTITDEDELQEELAGIREQGYAVNRQESVSGLRSISAPVQKNGDVIAAISIAGPAHRLTDSRIDDEISTLLLESSNEIELKMEYA